MDLKHKISTDLALTMNLFEIRNS